MTGDDFSITTFDVGTRHYHDAEFCRKYSFFVSYDFEASRRIDISQGDLTVFLEITDIYNRENPCCTEYRVQADGGGNQTLDANQGNWLP